MSGSRAVAAVALAVLSAGLLTSLTLDEGSSAARVQPAATTPAAPAPAPTRRSSSPPVATPTASRAATTAAPLTPPPSPSPVDPGPGRLLVVESMSFEGAPARVVSLTASGGSVRPEPTRAAVPLTQVATGTGLVVRTQRTRDDVDYAGPECRDGGCSSVPPQSGIVLTRADGSGARFLRRGGHDRSPAWSPDGRTIAYLSHRYDVRAKRAFEAVALMDAQGRDLGLVDPGGTRWSALHFAWAPDGRSLAVTRTLTVAAVARPEVVLITLQGAVRRLSDREHWWLAFSPDGRWVAGVRPRAQPGGPDLGADLWVLSTTTGAARQVTRATRAPASIARGACDTPVHPSNGPAGPPAWSRDGRLLAYPDPEGRADASTNLVVVDVRTGRRAVVRRNPPESCEQVRDVAHRTYEVAGWV